MCDSRNATLARTVNYCTVHVTFHTCQVNTYNIFEYVICYSKCLYYTNQNLMSRT